MSNQIKVAVDAMGGDYAPTEPVKGAVEAAKADSRVQIALVGQPEKVKAELDRYEYPKDQITVVPASEVIETGEPPVHADRKSVV